MLFSIKSFNEPVIVLSNAASSFTVLISANKVINELEKPAR